MVSRNHSYHDPYQWTNSSIAYILDRKEYLGEHCTGNGYPGLKNIAHTTVRNILENNEIKPNKMNYYLVKKDPEFESKMHEVLVIYK